MQKPFVAALAFGAAVTLVSNVLAASTKRASFGGTWSARLVTEAGSCDASYSYTIVIQNGQVRPVAGVGDAPTSISGGVGSDGSVMLGVRRSFAQADASGRLKAGSGSGIWSLSVLGCTGRWTAQRRTTQAQAN